ncbi:MAG: Uma2 family endonuclease [Candidatus Viridilinea halotolerans]|uniref:Uma2 family endonuclease n=1 Tax=Candidatus Viridilinea halotolerans TaxID=2491704 RepID=A0A426TVU9_9CHLR|nr:MAG: Uma2 family endonuclease [Candidatus Viridilinea halotolerans]
MRAQPQPYITEEAYLEQERRSITKSEYYAGQIYAMTGAKEAHNLIVANVIATLHGQLRRKPCRVYANDMRVKVLQTGLFTYPDVVVVCGQPEFVDKKRDTLTNPTVVIEVLSPSTERYDRGLKFRHYRTIETLNDYILIAQDRHALEYYTRHEHGQWLLSEANALDAQVTLASIACALAIADVYEKVELEEGDSAFLAHTSDE